MRSAFKMKGYSYPGQSPIEQKTDPPVLRSELDEKGKKLYDSNIAKLQKKKYDMEQADTADNSGPVKPINKTVASNTRVFEQDELINTLESNVNDVTTDVENGKVSKAEAKKIIAGYEAKISKLR